MVRCPYCRGPVDAVGEIVFGGRELTVYQCPRCTRPWIVEGESFDCAVTFALDEDGSCLDPESGEQLPPPSAPGES